MFFINFLLRLFGLKRKRKGKSKKEIIRERNRRIGIIMNHLRQHQQERDNSPTSQSAAKAIERIRKKKEQARAEGERTWGQRVTPVAGRNKNVEMRVENLRERVRTKRSKAREKWAPK